MSLDTIRELNVYNRWANQKVMRTAAGLTDEHLDAPVEMGWGSLRANLRHIYGAERIWHKWTAALGYDDLARARDLATMDDLATATGNVADARDAWLAALTTADLDRTVTMTPDGGVSATNRLGDVLIHLVNHGIHHRAQALNMLRHHGVKPPGLDYLFMRLERPTVEHEPEFLPRLGELDFAVSDTVVAPAPLDLATIRDFFRYGDWAFGRVAAVAAVLSDEQLDRSFEMGLGTVRKTLIHIRDAEHWWYRNWTEGPQLGFDDLAADAPIADVLSAFTQSAQRRDSFFDGLTNDDLHRVVSAYVRNEVKLNFRLGESMLQLLGHGTHHRAQAVNMLRRLGTKAPELDLAESRRGPA